MRRNQHQYIRRRGTTSRQTRHTTRNYRILHTMVATTRFFQNRNISRRRFHQMGSRLTRDRSRRHRTPTRRAINSTRTSRPRRGRTNTANGPMTRLLTFRRAPSLMLRRGRTRHVTNRRNNRNLRNTLKVLNRRRMLQRMRNRATISRNTRRTARNRRSRHTIILRNNRNFRGALQLTSHKLLHQVFKGTTRRRGTRGHSTTDSRRQHGQVSPDGRRAGRQTHNMTRINRNMARKGHLNTLTRKRIFTRSHLQTSRRWH